ncbi:hypothetical protein CWE09_09090 [Aliidiomarina minuta]|uniref:YdbS-like PH domain-containing protein n=1 Tax=Aliidiomarina minuta TaxID=880057 RepID=A0A432W9J9_9GAMM|nr:PH domain-containing protein [Aliidiomarina minuta]RUO26827.1 hypothetical protein CWE09_09090 [Aliidiomarina minuta]
MSDVQYQPVSPDYKHLLRVDILVNWGLLLVAGLIASYFITVIQYWHTALGALTIVLIMVLMMTLWVTRRYRLTGYQVQPQQVHFRTGALWRTQTAVAINRIQHVEITQGPVERYFKLAKLVIYTAGGSGSDLSVPGLPQAEAEQIRDQLLQRINQQTSGDDHEL